MADNFDLKRFLLENKLTAPSEIYEEEEGVQEVYDRIIKDIETAARKLTDKQASELHEKFKKFFVGGIVNEVEQDNRTGLYVTGTTTVDNTRIGKMAEEKGLHGEWNAREGYWFFQEDEEMYDELEKIIQKGLDEYQIDARIEGI